MPAIFNSTADLADVNNDGSAELIFSGINSSFQKITKVYRMANDTLTEISLNLPGFSDGSVKCADFNNDGYFDILFCGISKNGTFTTSLYSNNFNKSFTKITAPFENVAFGKAFPADLNNDGLEDVILSGATAANIPQTKIYVNKGNFVFEPSSDTLQPFSSVASLAAADYDKDGKTDFLISGFLNTTPVTLLYKNFGDFHFQAVEPIPSIVGIGVFLDADNDLDPDLMLSGVDATDLTSKLFINDSAYSSPAFSPPTNLTEISSVDSVVLYWSAAEHEILPTQGLTYNIYLKSSEGKEIIHPYAFVPQGGRKTGVNGNVGHSNKAIIKGLPLGVYKWRIQAIDNNGYGSAFSSEKTFIVCKSNFVTRTDTSICAGDSVVLSIADQGYTYEWTVNGNAAFGPVFRNKFSMSDTILVTVKNGIGCLTYDTVAVKVHALPYFNLGTDTTICKNSMLTLKVGNQQDSTIWFRDTTLIKNGRDKFLAVVADASRSFSALSFDINGCKAADTIKVFASDFPTPDAGADKFICNGDSVEIGEPGFAGIKYKWQPSAGIKVDTISNPIVSPAAPAFYFLEAVNEYGCSGFDTVFVDVDEPSTMSPLNDLIICKGDSAVLGNHPQASGSRLPYSYHWFPSIGLNDPAIQNPTTFIGSSQKYGLEIKAGSCLIDTLYIQVTVKERPLASVAADSIVIAPGESAQLFASGGTFYQWSPVAGLDNYYLDGPVANPDKTTLYTVLVSDGLGCSDTAWVKVIVKNEVFVPDIFTPNSDEKNDLFKIYGIGLKEGIFQIFNLEGKLLFTEKIKNEGVAGWDGTFNGEPQASGTYLWSVKGVMVDGSKITYQGKTSGSFKLIR